MNMLMGMAKPMPSLPPELLAMAVLMPMISPRRLHQRAAAVAGIDGRVGLQEVLEADSAASPRCRSCRPLALMMPKVTEWLRPKGLPTASTKSPISIRSLSPSGGGDQVGRLDGQHGHVGLFVLQHALRVKPPAVGQVDADAVRLRRRGRRAGW